MSRLDNLPRLNDFDLDENLRHSIDSKYHKVSDLSNLNTAKTFSLFHVNIRSLTKHFSELHLLINSTKIPLDIIGITESKQTIGMDFALNVNMDGYNIHTQPTQSSHGGIAMYLKKTLDYKIRDDLSVVSDEYETLWVEINTGSKAKNILCCCAYRHPNTDIKSFIEYMDNTLQKLEKSNKTIFVMGDFNINLLSYDGHTDTNDFINSMVSHYLLPYILHPTRVTDHSSTVIDNIFSNVTDFDTVSGNIINQIADHFAQFLILKKIHIEFKNTTFYQHDYSSFQMENFVGNFSDLNWDKHKDPCEDVNATCKFTFFHDQLSKCVRRHVPLTKVSQKALSFRDKPWITLKIQRMMARRDKYLNKFHKTRNLDTEYLYKKFRNKVVFEIRKSRNDYYNNYFNTHKSNMKKLWSGIRSIINVSSKSGYCISQLIQDGKEIDDPKTMANIFKKFFVNVSQKVTSGIPKTHKCPLDYLKQRNDKSLFLSNATPEEIEALINSLQEGKAVGPHSVPIKLLKMISRPISLPLCLIINESFTSGIFPDNLNLAKVITLYKKGSRDNPTNYRPNFFIINI